jgi:DNA-binding transcriptional regulator GbsR (MarR family)
VAPLQESKPFAFGISFETGRALADAWKFRILGKLSEGPLSPSVFVEEVGGELSHISRCFRQLADAGYLEVVEVRPGRRRGAALEHVYRAVRRGYFDTPSWEGVPRSKRESLSRMTLDTYFERVRGAREAGTFDQETNRHLSWDEIALDPAAWREVGRRLDDILASLAELEVEAARRLANTEEEPIPTSVGLTLFRSPQSVEAVLQGPQQFKGPASADDPGAPYALGPELAKALSNKWRFRILMELSNKPLSPSQFIEDHGGSMTHVSRCFRELAEWGFLEVFEERKGGRRGGGIEKMYRCTRRPYFDTPTWESFPQVVREEISQYVLNTYVSCITQAIEAGTFDADVDRHLSWKPVVFDREAWTQVTDTLDEMLALLPELEAQSLERTPDVEQLIPTVVGLACFRSPSGPLSREKQRGSSSGFGSYHGGVKNLHA